MSPSRTSAEACLMLAQCAAPGTCSVLLCGSHRCTDGACMSVLRYPPLSLDQARRVGLSSGPIERGRVCGLRERD